MVAVPELPELAAVLSVDAGLSAVPVARRRAVAISASPMELLRPESELARLLHGFAHTDLLVAVDDLPPGPPGPVGVLSGVDHPASEGGDQRDTEPGAVEWDPSWGDADEPDGTDEVVVTDDELGRLALPGLHVHRLGLRAPLNPLVEDDLVAALSELVGFDPEPGVYCLAPAPTDADPDRVLIDGAVQRIVSVYGLPLLRYRCLELSVVAKG